MDSQKSFNAFRREQTLSELELESLLLEDGTLDADAVSGSNLSSALGRPNHWVRDLIEMAGAQCGYGVSICPQTRRPSFVRRLTRLLILTLAVAAGAYVGM